MNRSKSGLFLMELIIAICFFAIASAVCVQLFATAHRHSRRSIGIQMAVLNAQNAAESFRATGSDLGLMADILQATVVDGGLVVRFDEDWNNDHTGRYEMVIEKDLSGDIATANIRVVDSLLDEELHNIVVVRYLGLVR